MTTAAEREQLGDRREAAGLPRYEPDYGGPRFCPVCHGIELGSHYHEPPEEHEFMSNAGTNRDKAMRTAQANANRSGKPWRVFLYGNVYWVEQTDDGKPNKMPLCEVVYPENHEQEEET